MIIRPSSSLRNSYNDLAKLAKESEEPIYITNKGVEDLVIMSVDAYERREQLLRLQYKLDLAERSRLEGLPTVTLEQARQRLQERLGNG